MQFKRILKKSSEQCSCCGNKSVKQFEVIIIENPINLTIFYICNNCQKNENIESKEITNILNDQKLYIG